MSVAACADLVARGDPDRFAATMTAADADRARLWPLYAFNLEVARAGFAPSEPLIAEMRLQFWADVVAEAVEGRGRAHEVAEPLAALIAGGDLPPEPLAALVEARRWDAYRAPFAEDAALLRYLDETGGGLMWAAAVALGAGPGAETAVRDMGRAAALANWLAAVPALEASGRLPLVDGRPPAVAALARQGLGWIDRARRARATVPARARPALLAGWRAGAILSQAAADPARVAAGGLAQSEFARRGTLLLRTLSGRW